MSWGYLRGVTHLDLGRQYESLPYAGMLFFAAVFGAHFHVISLPIGVLAGVALLLLETTVSVTSQGLSVVKRLGRIPLRRDHWAKDQILGPLFKNIATSPRTRVGPSGTRFGRTVSF